jgi:hypothetical protein
MRAVATGALMLLILLAVPAAALGAKPAPRWPSAADLRNYEPALLPADARCIARYYHGRLSRKAWFTAYYDLTAAQKIATDEGPFHCMTLAQRIATDERLYTSLAGKLPQVHCVSVRTEALSRPRRLTETDHANWLRDYDGIFRSCGMIGALYGVVGKGMHLPLTAAERACANRVGSGEPVMYSSSAPPTKARLTAVGTVLDRCIGAQSEQAMYRYVYRAYEFPSKVPCIARRVAAAVGFTKLLNKDPAIRTSVKKAVAACLAGG